MEDKLETLFKMQEHLNKKIGVPSFIITTEQTRSDWTLKFTRALLHELIELERELAFKHWKKNQPINIPEAREEAIDILHFMISIFQALGMDHEDVMRMYIDKNKENIERQENGY